MDLTPEEVGALPLELACCWYLASWNKHASVTDRKSWAHNVGWVAFADGRSSAEAEDTALVEAARLYRFVKAQTYDARSVARMWLDIIDMPAGAFTKQYGLSTYAAAIDAFTTHARTLIGRTR